ncbi:hypothetical protein F5880DRAFT_1699391 [Lentinula raphanica]|nr:hypothetical protein F5880DRAFT_1699391 [Lentinula raphanica]
MDVHIYTLHTRRTTETQNSSSQNSYTKMSSDHFVNDVVSTVTTHLSSHLLGEQKPPILAIVHGPSRSGKTSTVQQLRTVFNELLSSHLLIIVSPSPSGAMTLGATALHGFLALGEETIDRSRYIIIDDCSTLASSTLDSLNNRCPAIEGADAGAHFGGRSVLLFGDLHQMPPPLGVDTLWSPRFGAGGTFASFQHAFTLRPHANTLDQWQKVCAEVRKGGISKAVCDELNRHALKDGPDSYVAETSFHHDVIFITPSSSCHRQWNNQLASVFAKKNKCTLYTSVAEDDLVFNSFLRLPVTDAHKLQSFNDDHATLLHDIPLCFGMPVTIDDGIWGTVEDFVVDEREDLPTPRKPETTLKYPFTQVRIRVNQLLLDSGFVATPFLTIRPKATMFKVPLANHGLEVVEVHRYQLPLQPRFAIMERDATGLTFPNVVLDTSAGMINYLSPYGALSRVAQNGRLAITGPLMPSGLGRFGEVERLKDCVRRIEGFSMPQL